MRLLNVIAICGLVLLVMATFATANVVTTTMTWFVASAKTITVSYGSPCTSSAFFFNETNAIYDPDSDGNASRVVPQATRIGAGDSNCQSSSQAAITVTNAGTATTNVDANFASSFAAGDVNIVLKVWQGSSGCGTAGLGGWEKDCSVTAIATAPNTTTCKQWNDTNELAASRVITNLAVFSSTQLCFSGDFNTFVAAGDHNATFQLGTDFS